MQFEKQKVVTRLESIPGVIFTSHMNYCKIWKKELNVRKHPIGGSKVQLKFQLQFEKIYIYIIGLLYCILHCN